MKQKLTEILALLHLGMIHPRLMLFAIQLRMKGKTFLTYTKLNSLASNYLKVCKRSASPPKIAEFGVGRGGSAMLIAWFINRYGGSLTLFDLFGRIPQPSSEDGQQAQERYQIILNQEDANYYGNLPDLDQIIANDIAQICPIDKITFIKGRYQDTLRELSENQLYDLIHIDCDWYESVRAVYIYLENRLQNGAILQIDDYFFWPGARKATDETQWLQPFHWKDVGGALVIDTNIRKE